MRRVIQKFTIALAFGIVWGLVTPGWAAAPQGINSDIFLPFEGTVFDPDTGENVALSGEVHVVALVPTGRRTVFLFTPFSPISTRAIVNRFSAVGETSEGQYDIFPRLGGDLHRGNSLSFSECHVISVPYLLLPPTIGGQSTAFGFEISLIFTAEGVLAGGQVVIPTPSVGHAHPFPSCPAIIE